MCLLGAGLGYFAYSNRRMRTRFVTDLERDIEIKIKFKQWIIQVPGVHGRTLQFCDWDGDLDWWWWWESNHQGIQVSHLDILSHWIWGNMILCSSFFSDDEPLVMWEVTDCDCDKNREAKEKGHSTHLYRLGWGTSDYLLWSVWTVDDTLWGYPNLFFPHLDIHWFLFWEGCVKRLVTTSLFFVISYITWSWVFDQIVHMCRMHRDNLFSM